MKGTKKIATLFFNICVILNCVNAQQQIIKIPPVDSIKKWQDEYKVPIVGVGIIEGGEIKQIKVMGKLQNGKPAPPTTFFNIASMTKPVVAMLTLQLVSQGKWSLDEPLSNYFIDKDLLNDPRHKKLTTRLVLSHQTGLPNWRGSEPSKKLSFAFEPGTDTKYSGEGFMYLAHALEEKFKMPLQTLTDSLLFKPLGMKNTRFFWDSSLNESLYANKHDENGKALEMEKWYEANASNLILTTVEDYCKFVVSVLQQKGISKEVYEEMITPQAPKGKSIYSEGTLNLSNGLCWGLAKELSHGEYAIYHGGRNSGVNTIGILLPKSKRGIVIFTNGENGSEVYKKIISQSMDLGEELVHRLYDTKP